MSSRRRVKSADDKERLVGLIRAPLAGGIGLLIINALIADDPAAPNKAHVNPAVYHELALVLLALAILMLIMALLRKRLFLGMAFALYGLAVFNLHYWGFGVPFILVGAWLLVRAYRVQRDLREAGGGTGALGRGTERRIVASGAQQALHAHGDTARAPPRRPSPTTRKRPADRPVCLTGPCGGSRRDPGTQGSLGSPPVAERQADQGGEEDHQHRREDEHRRRGVLRGGQTDRGDQGGVVRAR